MPQTPLLDANGQPIFETQLQAISEAAAGNGVVAPGDLAVSAGTGDLDLDVAAGEVVRDGATVSLGPATLATSAGDASEDRWDIVVADAGAGSLAVREGTPAQYPSPPALGSDDVLLAVVSVEAEATQVTDADILSWRLQGGLGGPFDALDDGTTVVAGVDELNATTQLDITQDGTRAVLALANDAVTISAGDGLRNGGTVTLGETTTLNIEAADIAGNALEDNGNDDLAVASNGIGTDELASGAVTDTEVASSTAISRDKLQGKHQTVTVSSDHTATNYERVLADASSNAVSVTLPAPSTALNVTVKAIDATNDVTVATPGSETIDGDAQRAITEQYVALTLTSDGSNYYIV